MRVQDFSADLLNALRDDTQPQGHVMMCVGPFHVLCMFTWNDARTQCRVSATDITTWVRTITKAVFTHNTMSKKQFLSHIFHEIRNHLDVITLVADELSATTSPQSDAFCVSVQCIDDNSRLIADILDDVVTFDNFVLLPSSIKLKPFMLHDLFKKVVHTMNTYINVYAVSFMHHNELRREFICADYFKLKQVLVHILQCATRIAEGAPGSHVSLRMARAAANSATVTVECVAATHTITKVMVTGKHSTAGSHNDVPGFAHAIVQKIVELHDGVMTCEASERGITWCVTLPLRKEEQPDVHGYDKCAPATATQSQAPASPKVLVVDDNAVILKLMRNMLERAGITNIVMAQDGRHAVTEYRAAFTDGVPFTHVLMDQEMPDMDGNAATRCIVDLDPHANVIGVTGNCSAAQKSLFLEHGARQVVNKPITPQLVRDLVCPAV